MSNVIETVLVPTPSPHSGFDRHDAISLGLMVGAGVVTALLWSSLPSRIPTHFDLTGQVDDDTARSVGVVLLPATAGALFVVLRVVPRLFGRAWRARAAASPMSLVTALTTALLVGLHAVCLWAALHPGASGARPLGLLLGAFWIGLSLVLPRVRRNPLVGFRTAWALASDENWASTHRFAGLVGVATGVVVLIAGLLGSLPAGLAALLVGSGAPIAHSFLAARRERDAA